MRRIILLTFMLFAFAGAFAQNISVADFYYAENDLTARTHGTSEEDQNGNICALIKVKTTEKGTWTFDVGMLGVTKTEMQNAAHAAEIWVYVPFGVTWMSIQHEKLGELDHYRFPCSIDKGCTYVMKLTTGKVITIVEEEVRQQYLLFQLDPPNAILEVNDKLWSVEADGTAMQYVDFGTYKYRVRASDYAEEVGKVTVDDPNNTKIVPVKLKSNLAVVTLKVDADAEIWVNNQKKGVRTWTGKLGSGTYKIECKQDGHETTMMSKEISTEMNGETIALPAPTPIYGSLMVESTPNLCQLYIDGKEYGTTPKSINNILVGQHEIRLTKDGYDEHKETVTIAKGERKQVKAMLNMQQKEELSYVATVIPYHLDFSLNVGEVSAKERNVMNVYLNWTDYLKVDGRPCDLSTIKEDIVHFITPNPDDKTKPECEIKHFDGLGDMLVTKGVVCFLYEHVSQTKEGERVIVNSEEEEEGIDDIKGFCDVISEILEAYTEARDELAMKVYHKHFGQLNSNQIEEIREAVPIRVVGLGEYFDFHMYLVANDVETEDGVEHVKINNAFLETCMISRDNCGYIKRLINVFKDHTSCYPFCDGYIDLTDTDHPYHINKVE